MGDGVLVYFGYPRAHEDDAERAVRAGLDVIDVVARLDVKSLKLQARLGIATGLVVVGDLIGEGSAREQSVVGETPNLAARLQALAEPGAIVIAAATRRLIGDAAKALTERDALAQMLGDDADGAPDRARRQRRHLARRARRLAPHQLGRAGVAAMS
jgi:class 3 adenylate cyclase